MEYDISVTIHGGSAHAEESPVLCLETTGRLKTDRQGSTLIYDQYDPDNGSSVSTEIRIDRYAVAMKRSDRSSLVFARKTPSVHPVMTPDGRVFSMTVVPYEVSWHQVRGKGSLHLAYDLIYDGKVTSNHDICFDFRPLRS